MLGWVVLVPWTVAPARLPRWARGCPGHVRCGLACRPGLDAWTLALAGAVKLGRLRRLPGIFLIGREVCCWWVWHRQCGPTCRRISLTLEKSGFRGRS